MLCSVCKRNIGLEGHLTTARKEGLTRVRAQDAEEFTQFWRDTSLKPKDLNHFQKLKGIYQDSFLCLFY